MRVMALQTLVARVSDGLPLSASIQDDEQVIYFVRGMKHFLASKLTLKCNLFLHIIIVWEKPNGVSNPGQADI